VKIAICAKHVPAGELQLDPGSLRLDRSGESELNRRDRAAVEAGLRLRDNGIATEVVLLTVGPENAVSSMREGLAMGASRAVVCADPRAAGSDLLATSRVLAALVERERPALTILGQLAGDSEGGALPAALARRLNVPAVTQAAELEVRAGAVLAWRQTEAGSEQIRAPLACVVSVTDAFEARFPTFAEMKRAADRPVEMIDLAELGVPPALAGEAGSGTAVLNASAAPRSGRQAVMVEDDGTAAERLLAYLASRGLV
jgi:electron transfer flavoprotein beta subunit